jgi:hypothetical protein
MQRDLMLQSLRHLGVPVEDFRVLKLLPLIWVAWADGKMESVEKDRIHQLAQSTFSLSSAGRSVLERWLSQAPTHEYVAEGLRDLYRLAVARDDMEVDLAELPGLLSYAEAMARSTAVALDQPTAVTETEEAALREIARALHVDHGLSWARLLRELQ